MKTDFASLFLLSACAVSLSSLAKAQGMSQPAQQPGAQQMQPPADQMSTGGGMQALASDQETTVSGVQVMCGGIGSDESDPRYANYPAKIEVAGGYGQWLGDNNLTIAGKGQNITARCHGPWFMAQLQPGSYTVMVQHGSISHTARISVAANGQHKVVVRFPELKKGQDNGQGQYSGQQMNGGTPPSGAN